MILYIGVLRAVDSVGCVVALRPDVDKQEERTLTRTETSVIFESLKMFLVCLPMESVVGNALYVDTSKSLLSGLGCSKVHLNDEVHILIHILLSDYLEKSSEGGQHLIPLFMPMLSKNIQAIWKSCTSVNSILISNDRCPKE